MDDVHRYASELERLVQEIDEITTELRQELLRGEGPTDEELQLLKAVLRQLKETQRKLTVKLAEPGL